MGFELGRLPPELRQLIWEATLPDSRVFHVSTLTEAPKEPCATENTKAREQVFSFHIRHAPPVAHEICRGSREVLLLRGYFLSSGKSCTGKPSTGPWFNPQRDMLYFDRNMRHCLKAKVPMNVKGMDRILHIGLEWRAWFRDVPRVPDDEDMYQQWKMAIEPLFLHCPSAESMSFVLPRVRHVGGIPSGREPYCAENYNCDLTPLPDNTQVPWERVSIQIANGAFIGYPGMALSQLGGESIPMEWKLIRGQMEKAIRLLEDGQGLKADHEGFRVPGTTRKKSLSVRGWWLVRPGAPTSQEEQEVQEFWL